MILTPHLRPGSLRVRLLLLVFAAVIPALVFVLYTDREQRRMAERHAQENLLRTAQLVRDDHKRLIEGARQLLHVLAHLPAVQERNAAACNTTMKGLSKEYPQFVGIGAVTPGGDRFCGGNFASAQPVNVTDRSWFQRVIRTREFTIGSYQIGRLAGRAVLPLAHPALADTGEIRAVVLAVLDLEWLKAMVAAPAIPPGSSVTMVDDNGLILAHHPGNEWVGKSITGTALHQAIRSGREGLHVLEGVDRVRRFLVFRSLSGGEESGALHLVLSTPQREVYAEAHRILRRNLLWLAVVSIAVFGAAWFAGEFFVVRQVSRLLEAARRIADGDLRTRTGLPYGSGELGQLARSFDEMAASLEARQEEARQAEAKARESERLAAMGATAASITHEIGNPLNGMYTTVQFLERQLSRPDGPNRDVLRSDVENLKKEIHRLRSLLQDLRFLVRPDRLNLKPVSLRNVAGEIMAMEQRDYAERGIQVELDFPDSLPPVVADAERLKQALLNLCKNAAEAMQGGGTLKLRGFRAANEVVLEVIDSGVGISPEVNVFDLFTTTKPEGLGMGLAIVRQIIAAHGGGISYTSEPGKGTTFTITMPATEPAERAA